MKKQNNRRGISAGTLAMLLLTFGVLLACGVFVAAIAGEALRSRADEAIDMAREAGVTLMSEAESALTQWREYRPEKRTDAAQTHTAAPQDTPQPKRQSAVTFTVAAAGAVHAPRAVRSGALGERREYDFTPVFAGLGGALSGADLALATLETAAAGAEKGDGNYNAPAQLLDALRECGVDLLSLATERALDMGHDGLTITISEMTARGIAHTGAAPIHERGDIELINIGGAQVAVLGYTYGLSEEGKAAATQAEREAVRLLDMTRMEQDIRQARASGANVVIVMPHWGTKNKAETPEEVKAMARRLAKAGADVILGTHPNVVQGTERMTVTRADGLEYEAVVCYSLGSLLTDARTDENTAGMIAQIQITYDPGTRRVSLGSLACVPVYIAMDMVDGENVFRVTDVENAQALERLSESQRAEAMRAAKTVREVTGQSEMEEEGQG